MYKNIDDKQDRIKYESGFAFERIEVCYFSIKNYSRIRKVDHNLVIFLNKVCATLTQLVLKMVSISTHKSKRMRCMFCTLLNFLIKCVCLRILTTIRY